MNVLIVYATVEGQTAKIARFAEKVVREAGHEVTLFDAGSAAGTLSLDGADRVILAAPVHERRHPEGFEALLAGRTGDLASRPTLLVSVSLSAAFEEGREEAGEYVTELKMRTGFTPDAEMLAAGAVRSGDYDYFASQVIRHVVLRDRDYDPDAGEHEFTDWDDLETRIGAFLDAPADAPA